MEDAAIDRGLPLFVEKPLARDLSTAARLAGRIRDRELLTCVGYHWRSLDVVEQTARLLQDAPAQLVTGAWLDRTPAAPWWSKRDGSGGQTVLPREHAGRFPGGAYFDPCGAVRLGGGSCLLRTRGTGGSASAMTPSTGFVR